MSTVRRLLGRGRHRGSYKHSWTPDYEPRHAKTTAGTTPAPRMELAA